MLDYYNGASANIAEAKTTSDASVAVAADAAANPKLTVSELKKKAAR